MRNIISLDRLHRVKAWYEKPLTIKIAVSFKKSTLIILFLLAVIVYLATRSHASALTSGIISPDTVHSNKVLALHPGEPTSSQLVPGIFNYPKFTAYEDAVKAKNDRLAKEAAELKAQQEAARVAAIKAQQDAEAAKQAQVAAQATEAPQQAVQSSGCVSGYSSGDYFLDKTIAYESSGNSCATNSGGCFGLLQACPGEPLRAACGGSPSCQIAWFQANKTGGRSWVQVWQHELDYGWW